MSCPSCGRETPAEALFCPHCAAPLAVRGAAGSAPGDAPTELAPTAPVSPASTASASSPSTAGQGRFLPGAVVAGRYRVVALLGRGGMGEVYRADDLKLGQTVALKFLPEEVVGDEEWLRRFLDEVTVARRVSHPNVCRVYDVGEVDGHHFLSMEYIDGEDLGSLLRRIGRLPQDKAVQIARQIAAGLAACHDQGILHRDLKPANVMIDGRGTARLTDFGLAAAASEIEGGEVASGTPAYMAPEQLAGREVTVRSDLYALGLVLYQLFTGKPAFSGDSLAEISRRHLEEMPSRPSGLVEGLDPAVERAILRCLEKSPADRPASALEVSAALPGGDPLAAALAAGETPSPELVAAAGESGRLAGRTAAVWIAGLAAALIVSLGLSGRVQLTSVLPMDKPRDVLVHEARELFAGLGADDAFDAAFGFHDALDVDGYLQREHPDDAWELVAAARPASLEFWYRTSPRRLIPRVGDSGRVAWLDPPFELSGMAGARLDPRGRLLEWVRVPEQLAEASAETEPERMTEDGWRRLIEAAGVDPAAFAPDEPRWTPPVFATERAAWRGELPELPGEPVRLEAAAYRGSPVWFRLVGPWTRAERQVMRQRTTGRIVNQVIGFTLYVGLLGLASWMARRHLRAGRGDRRGALRLAGVVVALTSLTWLLGSDHSAHPPSELWLFIRHAGSALFVGASVWVMYLAVEPFVRKYQPERVIAWSRLLAGRLRDPLIGRDVLAGVTVGAVMSAVVMGSLALERALALGSRLPERVWNDPLEGARFALSVIVYRLPDSTFGAMLVFFLWFLLVRLLRREWAASLAVVALLTAAFVSQGLWGPLGIAASVLLASGFVLALARFGLLTLIAALISTELLSNPPLGLDLAAWHVHGGWLSVALVVLVAAWAVRTATAGARAGGRTI